MTRRDALHPAHPRTAALDALLSRWAMTQRAQSISETTIKSRASVVIRLGALGVDPAAATPDDVTAFLADSGFAPTTRQTYQSWLTAWFTWLQITGRRADNPLVVLGKSRRPRRRPRPVTNAQVARLLATRMHRRTRTMILLAAYQGLRVHEIAKLRGQDIDLEAGRLRVVGKGGVDVDLPLHPLIAAEAEHHPRRGWWFPAQARSNARAGRGHIHARSVSDVIGDVMRRAGVPGSAHSLRHWYATELLRAGANIRVVQELLRHASLQTTQIYTYVADDERAAAGLQLPRFDRAS